MENSLFKKFDYYWFCLVFTAILGFGFFLANPSMGIDDELFSTYSKIYNSIYGERIGRIIYANVLHTFEYLPFWREFLAVSIYVVGMTLHAQNFMKYLNFENFKFDKKMATIFSCVAVSFPYIAFHFIFLMTCLEQAVNVLLAAVAVNCFYIWQNEGKKKRWLFVTFFLLFFTISVYETSIFLFLIPCLFIQLVNLIYNNEYKIKTAYKQLSISFLLGITSYFTYLITVKSFHKMFEIYNFKFNQYFMYDISSFKKFIISFVHFLKDFYIHFFDTFRYNFGSVLIAAAMIVFAVYICVQYEKTKKKNIWVWAILLTVLPFFPAFISGNVEIPFRCYSSFSFFPAMVLALMYNSARVNNIFSNVLIYLAALIVFYNTQELNQIFYTEYLKFQNDVNFANNLYYDLSKKNLQNKPIVFVGTREAGKYRYEYNEAGEIVISTFNWDRYDGFVSEMFVKRGYWFMRELGYDVRWVSRQDGLNKNNIRDFISTVKKNAKEMSIYPQENSIKDLDWFVLVKIGKSAADED